MGEAKIENGSLYYEVYGEGQPLVLICGLTGSIDYYWHSILPELAKSYQVIIFDSRGVGKTQYSDKGFLIEHIADDVSHLLDHLGIEKTAIFGHSMGSAVAQAFALKYPHRIEKSVLCNTFPKLSARDRVIVEGILSLIDEDIPIKKVFWSFMPWIFSNQHLEQGERKEQLKQFYASRVVNKQGLKHQAEALLIFDSTDWIDKIESDTLVISSKKDLLFLPELGESIAAKLPSSRYVEFDCGHATHVEKAPDLTSLIKDFIKP